jgi:hypothetical protein
MTNMKNSKIASLVLGLAMLVFGAASCDIFDPYDPGNGGGGNGGGGNGGGRDTIIIDDPVDTNRNDGDDQPTYIRGEGTVVWVNLEGGFWGIEAANGHEYEPLNLPEPFQVNGMKVVFSGKLLNWPSMHMWGETLEIGEISKG